MGGFGSGWQGSKKTTVEDCLVFGLPDERFGERVTAVVSLVDGLPAVVEGACAPVAGAASTGTDIDATVAEIMAATGRRLSHFKVPKTITVVPVVPRAANGKADYPAARDLVRHDGHDGRVPHTG